MRASGCSLNGRAKPSRAVVVDPCSIGPGDSVWDVGPKVYGIYPGIEHERAAMEPQRCIFLDPVTSSGVDLVGAKPRVFLMLQYLQLTPGSVHGLM